MDTVELVESLQGIESADDIEAIVTDAFAKITDDTIRDTTCRLADLMDNMVGSGAADDLDGRTALTFLATAIRATNNDMYGDHTDD